MFQFLNGSIKAIFKFLKQSLCFRFNSSMVRLKLSNDVQRDLSELMFQFLNGSIKAASTSFCISLAGEFQFLNGSIKASQVFR